MALTINGTDGIELNTDTGKLKVGTGDDLEIFHDGSNSYIKDTGTGALCILGSEIQLTNAANTENLAVFKNDGACELFHNGVKKLETDANGATVTGNIYTDGNVNLTADSKKIRIGAGEDMILYHDGSHSYLTNDTGNLVVKTTGAFNVLVEGGTEYAIACDSNGAVELYFNSDKKFNTTSSGSYTTGTHSQSGSDIRLKENIVNITNATAKLKQLQGFNFKFNSTGLALGLNGVNEIGLSAQDVEKVAPEVIGKIPNTDYLTVNYEKLVPILVESIKELEARIATLESA